MCHDCLYILKCVCLWGDLFIENIHWKCRWNDNATQETGTTSCASALLEASHIFFSFFCPLGGCATSYVLTKRLALHCNGHLHAFSWENIHLFSCQRLHYMTTDFVWHLVLDRYLLVGFQNPQQSPAVVVNESKQLKSKKNAKTSYSFEEIQVTILCRFTTRSHFLLITRSHSIIIIIICLITNR